MQLTLLKDLLRANIVKNALISFILYTPYTIALWSLLYGIWMLLYIDMVAIAPQWFADYPATPKFIAVFVVINSLFRMYSISAHKFEMLSSSMIAAVAFGFAFLYGFNRYEDPICMTWALIAVISFVHVPIASVQEDVLCTLQQ